MRLGRKMVLLVVRRRPDRSANSSPALSHSRERLKFSQFSRSTFLWHNLTGGGEPSRAGHAGVSQQAIGHLSNSNKENCHPDHAIGASNQIDLLFARQ